VVIFNSLWGTADMKFFNLLESVVNFAKNILADWSSSLNVGSRKQYLSLGFLTLLVFLATSRCFQQRYC